MVDSRRGTVARARPENLELAGKQLDVGAAYGEQAQLAAMAPGGELAQVSGVRLAGHTALYPARTPAKAIRS
ncbi:MAG TPA: hypothetical protein VN961_10440 [Streptosporangiaceae bacterium]|nr:hypothetical protein [Streptosporangiaceae bacterium]